VSEAYREIQRRDPELDIKYFDDLALVSEAGYLEEYTWVYLRRSSWQEPEGLDLSGFDRWKAQNLVSHTARTEGVIRLEVQ
jgi:hypothetical protein